MVPWAARRMAETTEPTSSMHARRHPLLDSPDFVRSRIGISIHARSLPMTTRKTSVEIDVGLLDDVRRVLGTSTLKETVEQAFLEVLRERARREEIEALANMHGMDLDDPAVMAGAWRT